MDNSWFQKAGSLEETKINETFFKPAGDLSTGKFDVSSYFSRPGDLEVQKQNNSFIFEEKKDEPFKTPEEIKEWLKTIVSGVKNPTMHLEKDFK